MGNWWWQNSPAVLLDNPAHEFAGSAVVSFDGQAQLGQQALFEGGGVISLDGLADLSAFQWEGIDVPVAPVWQDVD